MDNFIVSARKYRPTTFNDVVGQQSLTNTLKRAITSQKLASAYLFCGPRGVGKTTCARIFAKAINCLNPHEDGEACNECESCISFNEQRSMNVQELNAAANNSVEDIRQIIDQVRVPPQLGKYKVIILDEVHMLSQSAANALLKTLEEPPSYVIFILATTEKQKILPTILSRCQIFDFNRMGINDIIGNLKMVAERENIKFEEQALNIIAQKADGGMRDALSIFDQVTNYSNGNITYESVLKCLNVLDYDYYFKMTDTLVQHDVSQALLLFNDIVNKGFNGGTFMGGLASHLRDLLVSRDAVTTRLLDVADNIRQRYIEQAQKCPIHFLYKAIRLCDRCSNEYKLSYNKRLSVEITLIEVAQISEDDESAGHRPATDLKPLFKDTQKPPQADKGAAAPHLEKTDRGTSSSQPQQTSQDQPSSKPAPIKEVAPVPEKKTTSNRLKLHSTPSIRLHKDTDKASKPSDSQTSSNIEKTSELGQDKIEPSKLTYFWKQFAYQLPPEESAVSGRLESMDVELISDHEVQINVPNEIVLTYLKPVLPKMQSYLRKQLNNRVLQLLPKVIVTEQQTLRYNPRELFNKLLQENKGLAELTNELGLELD